MIWTLDRKFFSLAFFLSSSIIIISLHIIDTMPVLQLSCMLFWLSYYQQVISWLESKLNLSVRENVYSELYTCGIMKCVRVVRTCYAMACSTRRIGHVWMHTRGACTRGAFYSYMLGDLYVRACEELWACELDMQSFNHWLGNGLINVRRCI